MGRPLCFKCGSGANVSWAPRTGQIPGAAHSGRWICGDCLYKEEHPGAARLDPPVRVNRNHPQKETLFGG